VDSSSHLTSGGQASLEPPELPEGWRYADDTTPADPGATARMRVRVLQAVLVGLVVACVVGLAVWNGATHYSRGKHALEKGFYVWAADEFASARVFGIPFLDARGREQEARSAAAAAAAAIRQKQEERRLSAQFDKAAALLAAGDGEAVLTRLQTIDVAGLKSAMAESEVVRGSVASLAGDIAGAARAALDKSQWERAGRLAAALGVLEPSSGLAADLQKQAQTGKELSAKLGKAKEAARRGRWRAALRAALAVQAVQKGFPGAAALIADARAALAPKPKPVVTAAPATDTGGTAPTGPEAPAAPAPQPAPP
jgi:hypothetical protein